MARVKRGVAAKKRKKRILDAAKGNYGARGRLLKSAREAVERGAALRDPRLDLALGVVGGLARGGALGRRERADAAQQRGHGALLAEEARAHLLERLLARRRGDGLTRLAKQPLEVGRRRRHAAASA